LEIEKLEIEKLEIEKLEIEKLEIRKLEIGIWKLRNWGNWKLGKLEIEKLFPPPHLFSVVHCPLSIVNSQLPPHIRTVSKLLVHPPKIKNP
jgi:hypothetical protein